MSRAEWVDPIPAGSSDDDSVVSEAALCPGPNLSHHPHGVGQQGRAMVPPCHGQRPIVEIIEVEKPLTQENPCLVDGWSQLYPWLAAT
jgi:hypothetical protein